MLSHLHLLILKEQWPSTHLISSTFLYLVFKRRLRQLSKTLTPEIWAKTRGQAVNFHRNSGHLMQSQQKWLTLSPQECTVGLTYTIKLTSIE